MADVLVRREAFQGLEPSSCIGVTERTAAAVSLRRDVRGSVAAYEQSFPHDANLPPQRVSGHGIRRMNMKIHNGLLIAVAVACSISAAPAFAKK